MFPQAAWIVRSLAAQSAFGPVVLALGYTLFMAWLRKTRETALEAAEPSPAEPGGSGQTGQTSSTR